MQPINPSLCTQSEWHVRIKTTGLLSVFKDSSKFPFVSPPPPSACRDPASPFPLLSCSSPASPLAPSPRPTNVARLPHPINTVRSTLCLTLLPSQASLVLFISKFHKRVAYPSVQTSRVPFIVEMKCGFQPQCSPETACLKVTADLLSATHNDLFSATCHLTYCSIKSYLWFAHSFWKPLLPWPLTHGCLLVFFDSDHSFSAFLIHYSLAAFS